MLTENESLRFSSLVEPAFAESGIKAGGQQNKDGGNLEISRGDLRLGRGRVGSVERERGRGDCVPGRGHLTDGAAIREVVHADIRVGGKNDGERAIEEGFVVVRSRKGGKSAKRVAADGRKEVNEAAPAPSRKDVQEHSKSQGKNPKSASAPKIKTPRTAAVVLNRFEGNKSSGKILAAARVRVDLTELGIDSLRIRPSANEGRVFEIKGENRAAKAAELAAELWKVVRQMGVTATCPA